MNKNEHNFLLDIYNKFKEKSNGNSNSLEYISALLYLKYCKDDGYDYFEEIYNNREKYYISKMIDDKLKLLRENTRRDKLFLNLSFDNISLLRGIGEKSILSEVIFDINNIDSETSINSIDCYNHIGNSYKLLVESCFKMGEFDNPNEVYTPYFLSNVMSNLVVQENNSIFDPFCGSGSLLLSAFNKLQSNNNFFGIEQNPSLYNVCMTNFLLNKVSNYEIMNSDKISVSKKFDIILSNIPFSQKDWYVKITSDDLSFIRNGGVRDNSLGDYPYLLSMLNKLDENGTMAVILPHGVLFRESEERVRRFLVSNGHIEAIIGLPEGLFYSNNISVIIMVLSKKANNKGILFIDASKEFISDRKNNVLTKAMQDKIVDTYKNKDVIDYYSNFVSFDDIEKNNFNLTIKRYVKSTNIQKIRVKKSNVLEDLNKLEKESLILEDNINDVLETLGVSKGFVNSKKEKRGFVRSVDYKLIAENLKRIRNSKMVTVEDLASKANLSYDYLRRLELGKTAFNLKSLIKLCEALEISLDELLE